MIISKDFKEFIASLNAHSVRYLIVGGYAVAFHGHPRYTKDLDVWISSDPKNVSEFLAALQDFGLGSLGLSEKDFQDPEQVIQLGYPPNRIDLLTDIKGVKFDPCYKKRCQISIDGTIIPFLDLGSLIQNKKATGRHQDLADVEKLSTKGNSSSEK